MAVTTPLHVRRAYSTFHVRGAASPSYVRRATSPSHVRRATSPSHVRRAEPLSHVRRATSPSLVAMAISWFFVCKLGTAFAAGTVKGRSIIHVDAVEQGEDCRPPLGCFPLSHPWVSEERPIAHPPQEDATIAPRFCLHTPSRPHCTELDVWNVSSIATTGLSPRARVVLIAHGAKTPPSRTATSPTPPSDTPTNPLKSTPPLPEVPNKHDPAWALDDEDIVVVTVDWGTGAYPPYAQAVSNTRLVGALTGYLITLMQHHLHLPPSSFHLVGHSLGSHLMGYSGTFVSRELKGTKVGRITALDPAGPYFRGAHPLVRLDPSDADFVDVIHTGSNEIIPGIPVSLGNPDQLGHLDFYPNGGGLQPGCSTSLGEEMMRGSDIGTGFIKYINCHHQRSVDYFIESVSQACSFLAAECSSWQFYQKGRCWDCSQRFCSPMGFYATKHGYKRYHRQINAFIGPLSAPTLNLAAPTVPLGAPTVSLGVSTVPAGAPTLPLGAPIVPFVEPAVLLGTPTVPLGPPTVLVNSSLAPEKTRRGSIAKMIGLEMKKVIDLRDNTRPHVRQSGNRMLLVPEEEEVGRKLFYVTRKSFPFCGSQLLVTVTTSLSTSSMAGGGDVAQFSLLLRGREGSTAVLLPQEGPLFLKPGDSVSMVTSSRDIGELKFVLLEYVPPDDMLYNMFFRFAPPVLHVDSISVRDLTTGEQTVFPVQPQVIKEGDVRVLLPQR